jgi:phage shock protein C
MEAAIRHLTRSRRNRVFAGVCGGLADYLGWDAVLVRVAYVALTLLSFGGVGILLYLFAWMVVPLEGEQTAISAEQAQPRSPARAVVGILLLVVGALALLESFMPWFWHLLSLHLIAAIVLIGVGLILIFWQKRDAERLPVLTFGATQAEPVAEVVRGRLVRLQRGRKIAGVCSGLGRHFGIDPTIIRLLFLVLLLAGGGGLLLYIILWLVMPLELPDATT